MTDDPEAERAEPNGSLPSRMESVRARPGPWIAALLLAIVFGLIAWTFVGMLTVGVFVYYVTRPVFRRIEGRIRSRLLAVVLTLLVAALPVLLIVGWTVFLAYRELGELIGGQFGEQFDAFVQQYLGGDVSSLPELRTLIERVAENPATITELDVGPTLARAWEWLSTLLGTVVVMGLNLFVVLVVAFYLLKDDYKIADWARDTFLESGGVVEEFFVQVDYDLERVFFGNILNALVTGAIAVVVFLLLNLFSPAVVSIPEPILLGLLVGAASLIPLVGIKLVTVPIMAYLFGTVLVLDPQALWFPVAFTVLSFVVVDYIPDQLLRPYVSGRNLHVGLVILAYTFGPLIFGWYGIFLGPLLLVVGFEFARIVLPWLLGAEPAAVAGGADGAGPDPFDDMDAGDAAEGATAEPETADSMGSEDTGSAGAVGGTGTAGDSDEACDRSATGEGDRGAGRGEDPRDAGDGG